MLSTRAHNCLVYGNRAKTLGELAEQTERELFKQGT